MFFLLHKMSKFVFVARDEWIQAFSKQIKKKSAEGILCIFIPVLIPLSLHAKEMQKVGLFEIDRTEVTIGEFRKFIQATGLKTKAEKEGGGLVYESGWEQKEGWNWEKPYGGKSADLEPAVHVTFDEAYSYCRWAGKRLPSEKEWILAAYTELRERPAKGFQRGKTYPFPTGDSPRGANCLGDCGQVEGIDRSDKLSRGKGHSPVGASRMGVNGLFDMAANVWEWVDIKGEDYKGTRGGSWWYGAEQMRADYEATKPRDMAVVYIGFRCVRDDPSIK
jgi:sulfatase modifying factor 1